MYITDDALVSMETVHERFTNTCIRLSVSSYVRDYSVFYILPHETIEAKCMIIRGVVKIFSASYRRRVDTLLRSTIFLHMISLIKNAL